MSFVSIEWVGFLAAALTSSLLSACATTPASGEPASEPKKPAPGANSAFPVVYDEHGEVVAEASSVPVVPHKRAPIGSGDHRRELRPDMQRKRHRSADGSMRRRKHRADKRTKGAQTPPDPPNVQPSKCAFCNNVTNVPATASAAENPTVDQGLREPRAGAASDDPGQAQEAPHRSPSPSGQRSKWWPHRRAASLRSVRQHADEARDGQPLAPPDRRPAQDPEEADRDPSDRASRAPPMRPDG